MNETEGLNKLQGRMREGLYLLPFLFLFFWASKFVYITGSEFSDLTTSHYPNLQFLRDALVEYRSVPLWSPAILSGFPYFADPLSGLWYPPGWIAAIWPKAGVFNLLAVAHLSFGALGMGRYLRSRGLGQGAQWLGGLAFGLLPKMLGHFAAGHITLLYAVVWTPWLLLSEHRKSRVFRPAVILGVVFLADPRWAVYAGLLWLIYSFAHSHFPLEGAGEPRWFNKFKFWFRFAVSEVILSLLLASPLLVPLIEFAEQSSRALITPGETLIFSLPLLRIPGLFLPIVGGQIEWVFYAGGVTLLGSLAAAALPVVRKRAGFWLFVLLASLLFALGDQVPVLRLWASLPGAKLLRVPARSLFLFGLSLSILMAYGYDGLLRRGTANQKHRAIRRFAVGWSGFGLALLLTSVFTKGPLQPALAWSGISNLAGGLGLILLTLPKISKNITLTFLLLFVFLDSAVFAYFELEQNSEAGIFSQGEEAAAWLAAQPGRFRVYSPSYSIPQHTAVRYGLELADGVDPLQLKGYSDFMADATGVPRPGYRVTIPAIDGDPGTANADFIPNAELLGLLNVRYVISDFPVDVEGLRLKDQFDGVTVYENDYDQGRVWVEGRPGAAPVITFWSPNRIKIVCDCNSDTLVLSEIDYPGWQVSGGELGPPAFGILRSIQMDSSSGEIELVFRPISLYGGLLLWFCGLAWLFFIRKSEEYVD